MAHTVRSALATAALALTTITLAGCASSAPPTCEEFAAMGEETGLMVQFTSEQDDALTAALLETGYDDGVRNQMIARTEVLAYCNIYDGVAGNNQGAPITEAL